MHNQKETVEVQSTRTFDIRNYTTEAKRLFLIHSSKRHATIFYDVRQRGLRHSAVELICLW